MIDGSLVGNDAAPSSETANDDAASRGLSWRPATTNRLLAVLPEAEMAWLRPLLRPVQLKAGTALHAAGDERQDVLFVDSGAVSLVATFGADQRAETGLIGNEGFIGISCLLGARSRSTALVQVAGQGRLVSYALLERYQAELPTLWDLMRRYVAFRLEQTEVGMACNAIHSVQQRTARWLLMAADRAGPSFQIKQSFMADMLGVRRAGVSGAASVLQEAGLIRYSRGTMVIRDVPGLKQVACPCHGILQRSYAAVLPSDVFELAPPMREMA